MIKLYRVATIIIFLLSVNIPVCSAAWVWTPELGGWFNPKRAVKDTAQEQLTWAVNFYESKDYKGAISEFNKLVKYYPGSMHAPVAQYYKGRCYEDMEEFFHAYLAYQRVIEEYPHAKNREEIIMRQYRIGILFFEGQKAKVLGVALIPAIDKAIEIFEQVVANAPYGEYADQAQYKIGESFKRSNRFGEAAVAFQKAVNNYPRSELAEKANYEIAECGYLASLGYSYDQETTDAAIQKFQEFIHDSGDDTLAKEAKESLKQLREKKAQNLYDIAIFYERAGHHSSSVLYYKELIDKYPDSSLAAESLNRVMKLEKKLTGKKER